MILFIDNYDSFVYNLVQFVGVLEPDVVVVRNDEIDVEGLLALGPDALVVSPGPCTPDEAGVSNAAIAACAPTIPVLGVCLGMQCIAQVFGARVTRARVPMHGKLSAIGHCDEHLFRGMPDPLSVMRYHSLVVDRDTLPGSLQITAETDDGVIMAVRHRTLDVEGLQFHPESVFTEEGGAFARRFVERVRRARASGTGSGAAAR